MNTEDIRNEALRQIADEDTTTTTAVESKLELILSYLIRNRGDYRVSFSVGEEDVVITVSKGTLVRSKRVELNAIYCMAMTAEQLAEYILKNLKQELSVTIDRFVKVWKD